MIRVLIISPGVATRLGMKTLLMDEPHIQVIGEAARPENAEARETDVDMVIWSPALALDQDTFSKELANLGYYESAGWLIIHNDQKIILPLARQKKHAWGLLPSEASKEELMAAIEAVSEGLVVTNPSMMEHLSSGHPPEIDENIDMAETLTGREVEILQLLAQGLTNKQIALDLGISAHTVKFHVSSIFGKMGTTNRTETVKLGLKKGLILL